MKSRKQYIVIVLLTLGVLILLNLLASRFFFRIDLTEDKRYTLSNATENLLQDISEPVTIRAYFTSKLPPQLDLIRRDFRDMLMEYNQLSDGMVVYEFIDPAEDETTEQQAQQNGIMQMQVQVREKDQMKAQIAYMGAIIEMGDGKELIPVIQTVSGMEYFVTSAIKKLAILDKPMVGLLTGNGAYGLQNIPYALRDLSVLYQIEEVQLSDTSNVLSKYGTLMILGPTDTIPDWQLRQLSSFVESGGHLLVALNTVNADLNSGNNMGKAIYTGLEDWLSQFGLRVNQNFVVDNNSVTVMATRQQGSFTVRQPIKFPYIPRANNFGDHPAAGGLEQLMFNFVSSIDFIGDTSINFTPVVLSSGLSSTRPAQTFIDPSYQWTRRDFNMGDLTLAAAVEIPNSKIFVVADADFPVSEGQQRVNPDNINFLVNAIDWLSDDTGLMELRTQGATARPIDNLEDLQKLLIKYINFLLPILLIILYGIYRMQRNRTLKLKRKEEGYV
jgi:gliding-associated putative ABC transporter substrate-binding component GldG